MGKLSAAAVAATGVGGSGAAALGAYGMGYFGDGTQSGTNSLHRKLTAEGRAYTPISSPINESVITNTSSNKYKL